MTQPIAPGGPSALLPGGPAPLYPAAPQVGQAGAPAAAQPTAIDQMLAEAQAEAALVEAEEKARAERLADVGALETVGTQVGRGLLDYVMGTAALGAALAEGTGEIIGSDWLVEHARGVGQSASGAELMSTYMALQGFGESKAAALSEYERTKKTLREQEEAWPMLSAVSHVAGAVAGGLGTGMLASGGASLGTLSAAGAFEGAGGGAQIAYSKNAPLRDVFTSALIGATVTGGLTYGVGRGAQALAARADKAKALREAFGDVDDVAKRAGVTVEEAGGREAQSVIGDLEKFRKAALEAAEAVKNPTAREQVLAKAVQENSEALAKKAGKFDPAAWTDKAPSPLQKVIYRTQILDRTSDDVAEAVAKVADKRPGLDVALDVKRIARLTKQADAPAAIGAIQTRVGQLMSQLPKSVDGDALRFTFRDASSRLMKADLPGAMKDAHDVVRALGKTAVTAQDDATRFFAERAAKSLADDLTGEAFGDAGKLYAQLIADPSQAFTSLGQRELAREALRTMTGRGALPEVVRAEANAIAAANDAASKLFGHTAPKGLAAELRAAENLMAKAEAAVTLDGGPVGRVFDWFKNKASSKVTGYIGNAVGGAVGGVVGGWPGAMIGSVVANTVQKRIGSLVPLLKGAKLPHIPHIAKHFAIDAGKETARAKGVGNYLSTGKHASLSTEEKHKQNDARREALEQLASADDSPELMDGIKAIDNIAPGLGGPAAGDMQEKLAVLSQDLIKPQPNIRGKAFEVLSTEDLRRNNAMWEATVDPMSVYDDLAAGSLDYDKLSYTWKQYPGLLVASQMALVDIVHHQLGEEERAAVPENVLSQLDLAFQMQGGLTKSLDRGMSQRIDQMNQALAQQAQAAPRPQGQLKLPGAKPTPVMRIAGNV